MLSFMSFFKNNTRSALGNVSYLQKYNALLQYWTWDWCLCVNKRLCFANGIREKIWISRFSTCKHTYATSACATRARDRSCMCERRGTCRTHTPWLRCLLSHARVCVHQSVTARSPTQQIIFFVAVNNKGGTSVNALELENVRYGNKLRVTHDILPVKTARTGATLIYTKQLLAVTFSIYASVRRL